MKLCAAILALGLQQAHSLPVVGEYGDGNTANDDYFATVVGGDLNTASGKYATIGGGYMNYARGDYSTISGGQANTVVSNYGSILGGYSNIVSGRFGTVLGGSKNTASGRHSAALGFSAVSSGDFAFTACFTGSQCVNDVDNSIAFFADQLYLNDIAVHDLLPTVSRMLKEDDAIDSMESAMALAEEYESEFRKMEQDIDAALAKQGLLLNGVSKHLR